VHFLDVGQADSILIQLPNGQVMLIDGGNNGDGNNIMNYMRSRNISTIDYLIATHPHADHIGGLPAIINGTNIGEIYMPRVSHTTQTFERLLTAIENKGLQINTARAGVNILSIPDLQIDIIAPVRDNYSNLNDHSAVIKIVYGNTSFLFMGDAEALSEGHITTDVSADVLKVGHHGSRTSTTQTFLNKVSPTFAVISVGSGNSYGHPTDEVLNRLNNANVKIYRTDLQGTIVFTSDGNTITVNTEPTLYQAPTPTASPTTAPTSTPEPSPTATATPTPTPTPEPAPSVMVWLAASGERYHRINNCGRMNPDRATQVTLENAKSRGFTACANCRPPN
jgi:competence protein ComEC